MKSCYDVGTIILWRSYSPLLPSCWRWRRWGRLSDLNIQVRGELYQRFDAIIGHHDQVFTGGGNSKHDFPHFGWAVMQSSQFSKLRPTNILHVFARYISPLEYPLANHRDSAWCCIALSIWSWMPCHCTGRLTVWDNVHMLRIVVNSSRGRWLVIQPPPWPFCWAEVVMTAHRATIIKHSNTVYTMCSCLQQLLSATMESRCKREYR